MHELRAAFERDGYAVREGFVSPDWCQRLKARIRELVAGFDASSVRSIFSTNEQTRVTDAYFLGSGDDVRFFFEEEALAPDGELLVPKERAINKIGHALHQYDAEFRAFGEEHDLVGVGRSLGVGHAKPLQSMAILKPPGIGGEVRWHQDATFLHTEPPSVVGLWVALDDATQDNGCLWAIPGGHRGPLRQRFVRRGDDSTCFDTLDDTPFDTARARPIEAPAGTLVALHGMLPHRSDKNRSSVWRHAYSLHVIDGTSAYPRSNWLRAKS